MQDPEDAGCGPPHMFPNWSNRTVAAGESLMLTCPLDTKNSCIIDFVEWLEKNRLAKINDIS